MSARKRVLADFRFPASSSLFEPPYISYSTKTPDTKMTDIVLDLKLFQKSPSYTSRGSSNPGEAGWLSVSRTDLDKKNGEMIPTNRNATFRGQRIFKPTGLKRILFRSLIFSWSRSISYDDCIYESSEPGRLRPKLGLKGEESTRSHFDNDSEERTWIAVD